MIFIQGASETIQAAASVTADLDCESAVVPYTASGVGTPTPKETNIVNTTATDIVAAVGASTQGDVRYISIHNKHASAAPVVTISKNATTAVRLFKATLQPGWTLIKNADGTWFVYDANGGVVMGASAASTTQAGLVQLADAAAMEGAASTTLAVTPGLQHRHPATAKCWGMATVAANVPTLQSSYGISSITDSATGQILFTFSTVFSSTNYAVQCNSEYTATTYAVANDRKVAVRNASRAVGSVSLDCIDSTATTNLKADPATWFFMANGDQ